MDISRADIHERGRGALLPLVGLVVGAWSMLPPYLGPNLPVGPLVEVVDHVVPGVVVLVVSAAARAGGRAGGTFMFAAGLLVALAGFWMTATHVPLLAQAARGGVPWLAAIWHSLPGLVVVCLGAVWALRHGKQEG